MYDYIKQTKVYRAVLSEEDSEEDFNSRAKSNDLKC